MIMYSVSDIRQYFIDELRDKAFTEDRTGQKTIELLGASFLADEPAIFGMPNQDYIEAELEWYNSCSTNINDIHPDKDAPAAWQYAANDHGEINSNYGHLIFDEKLFNQYDRVCEELYDNPDSRRASMIYQRPSIWVEYNENNKNDFICTNAVTYYIRNEELQAVVQMRSNDVVFGYRNDYAWQKHVADQLAEKLGIHTVEIIWNVGSLHVYERHFNLVAS